MIVWVIAIGYIVVTVLHLAQSLNRYTVDNTEEISATVTEVVISEANIFDFFIIHTEEYPGSMFTFSERDVIDESRPVNLPKGTIVYIRVPQKKESVFSFPGYDEIVSYNDILSLRTDSCDIMTLESYNIGGFCGLISQRASGIALSIMIITVCSLYLRGIFDVTTNPLGLVWLSRKRIEPVTIAENIIIENRLNHTDEYYRESSIRSMQFTVFQSPYSLAVYLYSATLSIFCLLPLFFPQQFILLDFVGKLLVVVVFVLWTGLFIFYRYIKFVRKVRANERKETSGGYIKLTTLVTSKGIEINPGDYQAAFEDIVRGISSKNYYYLLTNSNGLLAFSKTGFTNGSLEELLLLLRSQGIKA
jgi:hypothetical protein